jgi:hypothetical protein
MRGIVAPADGEGGIVSRKRGAEGGREGPEDRLTRGTLGDRRNVPTFRRGETGERPACPQFSQR